MYELYDIPGLFVIRDFNWGKIVLWHMQVEGKLD